MAAGSRRRELNGQYGWETCPEPVRKLVMQFVETYRTVLGDNLTGLYLHGSLAMGCFNPLRSDIDILAVVRQPLSVKEKQLIIGFLLGIRRKAPPKGIEMSIVLANHCRPFVYPTPFELHYSPAWDKKYRDGEVDFTEERTDEDIAAHAVIIRKRGICLFGKPVSDVFGEVPPEYYRASLLSDARWILGRLNEEDPLYVVLNFCRILAFFKDRRITSKMEGGEWAINNLPERFGKLVSGALDGYSGRGADELVDTVSLDDFIRYMKGELGLV
ncbi:MAG: DUF4111 domain-containing protein [Dehalococcoidales bacterium]|nr:DUF4111 domain-containing protein [Dehalococcoidales bacterium]